MKEVLVVYYSQTGQLFDIVKNVVSTIEDTSVSITYFEIIPEKPFEFPWNKDAFFDAFPESFLQIPASFVPPSEEILNKKYDLVILGHQVWYLTPSIPLNSFLKSDFAKKLLKDTPVVTIIGARNMWVMAQEKVKRLLVNCGAQLVGNIALVDRHINHISVITIVHWMMKGKKDKMWGIFPKPGVSEEDIAKASKFGNPIKKALLSENFSNLQSNLLNLNAVIIKPFLVIADSRANLLFSKWANLIIKKGSAGDPNRKKWLKLFNYYLLFAIWFIAPIVFIVFLLTYIPMYKKMNRDKEYYASVYLK
ncbi:MAG: dialkylresorcinol condensing enzyme DarA [Maribacter sp.]